MNADIVFAQSTIEGTNWSSPCRANSDTTTNDQWQPAITDKPDGTKLFIGWYDRRNDSISNSLIQTYGVFATLPIASANSFSTNFAISAVTFPPAFTGTTMTNIGQYDPAYGPTVGAGDTRCCASYNGDYASYMGDYDTAFSANSHVY